MLCCGYSGALRIRVHHAHERGVQQLAQYAQVVPSERTCADYGDSDFSQALTYHALRRRASALFWISR